MQNFRFAIIPTVAVADGKAALPVSYDGQPQPPVSPLEAVKYWHQQGAARIEIIDSNAARGGNPDTGPIRQAIQSMRQSVHIDLVAGIHDLASLQEWKQHGPAQLVLSTSAVADLGFISAVIAQEHGRVALRLVVGDEGALHAPGSAADGRNIWELLPQLDQLGIANYIVCDSGHRPHWWQPHRDLLADFCQQTSTPVTAGSGVDSLEDLHHLADLVPAGIDGAVIGRALAEGYFSYAEALTAVEARYDPYEWGPAQP